jgi:tetratricopeptide (TPR) repeat protein
MMLKWMSGFAFTALFSLFRSTTIDHPQTRGPCDDRLFRLREQLAFDPNNVELLISIGEVHRDHQDWQAALAAFDKAGRLAPRLARIDFHRSRVMLDMGQPKQAAILMQRYLADPAADNDTLEFRVGVYVLCGEILEALQHYQAAADQYSRAIELSTKPCPGVYLARAKALATAAVKQGKNEYLAQALAGLDEGIERIGPLDILQRLAIELERCRRNYDGALYRVDRIRAGFTHQEFWLALRGEILEQAQRFPEAWSAYYHTQMALRSLPPRLRHIPVLRDIDVRVEKAMKRVQNRQLATVPNASAGSALVHRTHH